MYAIVEVGSKQYRVSVGDCIDTERLGLEKAKEVVLDKVLLTCDNDKLEVGQPYLKNTEVIAEVLREYKGKKTVAFKYRRRKSSHTKIGHRQQLTKLKIKEIKFN